MMYPAQNEDQIMSSFFQNLNRGNAVLFVGKGASESDLTQEVCELPWSCIVTDRTEENFSARFVTDTRRPKEYCSAGEFPSNLFDRNNLAVIRLFGVDGRQEEEDAEDPEMASFRRSKVCQDMLAIVMRKIDILGMFAVVGYDLSIPDSLPRTVFSLSWEECQGVLFFFGSPAADAQTERLKDAAEKRGYVWCGSHLAELLARSGEQEMDSVLGDTGVSSSGNNTFYRAGNQISIPSGVVLRYRSIAELLTNEKIYNIRPYGRIQQSRWFFHFLTRSSVDGPQWYGYTKQQIALKMNCLDAEEMNVYKYLDFYFLNLRTALKEVLVIITDEQDGTMQPEDLMQRLIARDFDGVSGEDF